MPVFIWLFFTLSLTTCNAEIAVPNNISSPPNSRSTPPNVTSHVSNFKFEVIQPPPGYEEWVSPLVLPAPPQDGSQGWSNALKRAKEFVSQLTIEEKVNLTTGADTTGRCVGETGTIPRMGFNQPICLQDAPVGVRYTDLASYFPAEISVAATFDRGLMRKRGIALGAEFAGKGVNVALAPMMNLMRAPESGRNWEGFGADPFLSGIGSVETILGMQSQNVSACAKHYLGNEQEHYRGGSASTASSSNMDDRTLREVYGWPFAESVRAGVDYVMCSYNRVNQTQTCENSKLINGILKGEQRFQGVLVSDWAASISGVRAALAGLDMNMPGFIAYGNASEPNPAQSNSSYWGLRLIEAVRNGSVPITRLDDMAQRIISTYYKNGQDLASFPRLNFRSIGQGTDAEQAADNKHVNVQADHYKIIREIGSASIVLLKNVNKTLPLPSPAHIESIAILGEDAGDNPNGANGCVDRGCNIGTLAGGWGSGTAEYPYLVTPATAIEGYVRAGNPNIKVNKVLNDTNVDQITKVASESQVSLVHVNADSGEGYITVQGNVGDRNDLNLWENGDAIILKAAAVCSNVIVIIHAVGPVNMEAWINNPNVTAVAFAGLPGQESGNAEVDILWGKVNPSARLPFTIGKSWKDYPASVLYNSSMVIPQINYQEALNIDYRHFDVHNIQPRFEYGFGLSYTTFNYSSISYQKVAKSAARSGKVGNHDTALVVNFMIQNTGSVDGHEVAQLYLGFPASVQEPVRVLRGFERVMVKAGGKVQVSIKLRVIDISIWDVVRQEWVVPQGTIKVWVGSSSRDLKLQTGFSF
ncbi:family 3 glycoside hydrolase [Melampsora larici-populina 98AG31]|uniref:beta-glucosidase n=1 Tax=Melampsora larici-populina (strain 98AG31 / pathotype 3-4-7) TaxID=747676 RepID=F4R4U7_MELLP|nr:family 3 glycoside hydrolase [Melampsora larici-populina 98AG31]EGG12872.1 family 3 glycoside hydrolase [Melampsora larici-populina 98AG31]